MSDEFSVTMSEAQSLCVRRGLSISSQAIQQAGLKGGWGKKIAPRSWGFKKAELIEWISSHGDKPKEGWVFISQAATETGISIETIYEWVRSGKIKSEINGAAPGRTGRRCVCLEEVRNARK